MAEHFRRADHHRFNATSINLTSLTRSFSFRIYPSVGREKNNRGRGKLHARTHRNQGMFASNPNNFSSSCTTPSSRAARPSPMAMDKHPPLLCNFVRNTVRRCFLRRSWKIHLRWYESDRHRNSRHHPRIQPRTPCPYVSEVTLLRSTAIQLRRIVAEQGHECTAEVPIAVPPASGQSRTPFRPWIRT